MIHDMPVRYATAYRIRFGDLVDGPKGPRPRMLEDAIRVTSALVEVVEAFAEVYGGNVTPWQAQGDQYEVYLPTTQLPVMILPGDTLSQWYERWSGAGCVTRCNGVETLDGEACSCPPLDDRTQDHCRVTTRLSLLCPEVAVMGAGMLVTHGRVAAETLPSVIAITQMVQGLGHPLPATLRVVTHRAVGRRYIVPQVDAWGVKPITLGIGLGDAPSVGIDAGSAALPASIDPAPTLASPEAAQMRGREAVSPPAPVDQQLVRADPADLMACRALTETLQRELNDARKAALLPPLTAEMSVDELAAWQQLYRPVIASAENDLRQVLAIQCKEAGQDDNERHRWVRTVTGRQGLRDCGLADLHKLEIWTKETA